MKHVTSLLIILVSLVLQWPTSGRAAGDTPPYGPVVFRDDFSGYADNAAFETSWEVGSGQFAPTRRGRLVSAGQGNAVAYAIAAPDLTEQVMEATVTPTKRTSTTGWAAAGLTLYSDGGNFWRLSLVESPTRERYAELVEMRDGVWQAQSEAGTRLMVVKDLVPGFVWENDKAYRFRITLTRSSVKGEIFDVVPAGNREGALRYRSGYELPTGAPAVRSGRVALSSIDMEAAFGDVVVTSNQIVMKQQRTSATRYRVAVHNFGDSVDAIVAGLKARGMDATVVDDRQVGDNAALNPGEFDALVLPEGARCPIAAKENLLQFLKGGGDMLVVGGPLFEQSIKSAESEWNTTLQSVEPSQIHFDFGKVDVTKWERGTNNPNSKTTWVVEPSGPPEAPSALRVDIHDLTGWDTLATSINDTFPQSDTLTMFWAKGDEHTTSMLFELQEKDKSRWIATVLLTSQWKRYILAPEDFLYWSDNPSKGRGGPGDRLNPLNAARLSVGLAMTHASVSPGRHTFWIAAIGSGRLPEGLHAPDLTLPTLEMFSPFYKYYRLPSLHLRPEELEQPSATGNQTGPILCPIPRPRGVGFAGNRRGRWIPLSEIRDTRNQWRGAGESLFVNLSVPYRGSVWGQIAGVDNQADIPKTITAMLQRMSAGVFIARAGAEQFSYFTDETVPLGAQVVNFSPRDREIQVTLRVLVGRGLRPRRETTLDETVRESDTSGRTETCLYDFSETLRIPAGRTQQIRKVWKPSLPKSGFYQVVAELKEAGNVIDHLIHEFTLLPPLDAPKSAFVSVQDGDFYVPAAPKSQIANQKSQISKWYPYGVNYWQSNVAGMDAFEYWLQWLSPAFYDPEIVERDLTTLQNLGFTSVSVQLGNPDHVRQVNDFAYRAARHGIRTNLFIGGAHPFYPDENLFTRLIKEGRFAKNPNIWAYDIAWEHHLGGHDERKQWDRDWEQWVINHYGTLEHAEKVWGFAIPRDEKGKVTNPSDDQLRNDGPWLKMAAAYERCADDVISHRYGAVIRKLRALDPNHLISARSASQPSWTVWFAYDMLSCGKHFDFSSPEGYGGYGLRPEEAGFTVAYGRYAGNGKPVFWAEFGSSIYPYDTTGEKEEAQAKLHHGFAKMLIDSGANGLASWWSVGGYRVDEKSDYGIIAPDGTPRASALELKKLARQVTSPRSTPPIADSVTIDRDLHASAYQAVYENNKQSYVQAMRTGKMIAVRTAGTGTTSVDCPLTAVGNVSYDGFSPLKFLNAEFNWIQIKNAKGEWQEVADGDTVEVLGDKPIEARVSAGNTGDAKWLAKADPGAVRLIGDDRRDANSSDRLRLTFAVPLPRDVARYDDVEFDTFTISPRIERDSEVVFTLESAGRAKFGERRRVVVVVRN